jgi:signal transduction histidine kinase
VLNALRTDEFKILAAAAVFIALPSLVLSAVAVAVLGRESALMEGRLREAHAGAMDRAVARAAAALEREEAEARRVCAGIRGEDADPLRAGPSLEELCGPERAFREAYLLGPGGKLLFPDPGPDLPPPPEEWRIEAPEACRGLLPLAQAQEFAEGNPARARRTWKSLSEQCLELGDVRLAGVASLGEARCARKSGRLEEAFESYRAVAARFPASWGEGKIPLAAAALLEAAGLARETGRPREEALAWADLAAFLGRHEDAVPREVADFFRDRVDASGGPGARESLREARARRTALAEFRRQFGRPFERGTAPAGFLASADGKGSLLAVPLGEGSAARAALVLNLPHLADLFRQWTRDLRLEEDVLLALTTRDGKPLAEADAAPEGFRLVAAKPFPPPLEEWQATLLARKPSGVRALSVLRWSLSFWTVVLACAAVVGGTVIVVRRVSREIRLAREKTDFVSTVTHELKTPLTSIRMFTETLLTGRVRDEAEKRECFQVIAEETDRLSRLIARMLDFSKMERGLRRFQFREETPDSVAREAVQAFQAQKKTGDELSVQIMGPFPALVCDRDAVIEVLQNLLGNAFKYSRGTPQVTLRAWASRGRVNFAVMDRGIGIPKREQKKIFEKFYRVDDSLAREVEGCGLGLAISAHIAKAHGGQIRVESEPGQGSIFTLVLPEKGP